MVSQFIRFGTIALLAIFGIAVYSSAQAVQPERFERDFNVLFKGGEYMNLYAMGTLDHKSRDQVHSSSEATVSKFDLKAPGKAQEKYISGLRLMSKNDFDGAVESLKKATEIYPKYVAAHNALGCAYFQLKKYTDAREEFSQAIQLDDHLSSSFLNLGRAQLALAENAAAQASMEKASSIAPLDRQLLLALTYAQYVNHDYPAAIRTANKAHSQIHPDTAIVHYFAAASWQALHQLKEASEQLQIFLTEDPKSGFAAAAQRVLTEIRESEEHPVLASLSAPVFEPSSPEKSTLGQVVLQDLKEKQQIAEAESEGNPCSGCEVLNRLSLPERVENEIAPGPMVPASKTSPWSLRSTVNEVALFFSATENGKSVADLEASDVKLLDDRKPPAAILSFRSESDLPLRLGLLIDTSGSIKERFSFEQNAAVNFLRHVLTGKDDLAFVAGFSNSVVLAKDLTPDLNELADGIQKLVPIGGTAIWDAVAYAADKLSEQTEERPVARILVVISDGDDNTSSKTLKQALDRAERDEVIVYTVSTRYADAESQRKDPTGNRAMKVLAQLTGGMSFFPGSAGHLNRSLDELQQVIRSRYLISYRPASFAADGHYRSITIVAAKSGKRLKVNARKGYYSKGLPADGEKR